MSVAQPDAVDHVIPTVAVATPRQAAPSLVRKMLRDILETAVLTIAVFLLVRSAMQTYRISGTSMVPNFLDQQFVLVNKLVYLFGEPQRGDVIVFNNPDGSRSDLIKRVIGVPGDTVEVRAGQVYINGLVTQEPYTLIPFNYDAGPVLIGTDKLFVLGDNRPASADSHTWGVLSQSELVGKVWLSLWPIDTLGLVAHDPITIQLPVSSLVPDGFPSALTAGHAAGSSSH